MIKKDKIKRAAASGFTIIEAFVAITILLVAVLGPLMLITRAISDGNYAKNQVTASFLAQEGLDLVIAQATRYTNDPTTSLKRFSVCENKDIPCRVSLSAAGANVSIESASFFDSSFYRLYLHSATGVPTDTYSVYDHAVEGVPSIFQRQIWFERVATNPPLTIGSDVKGQIDPNDEFIAYRVYVKVTWTDHGLSRDTIASTLVYE